MSTRYSDDQLRLAARLYYLDGLGQTEVAKFVKVSQAQVSRLLALARQRGIVRISVAEYEPRNHALEAHLKRQLGLKAVAVIKTMPGATPDEARTTVAHFGAPFVSALIPRSAGVAVAGGRTIRELVQLMPEDKGRRPVVAQAMGSIDSTVGPVDAFELGRTLASRLGGTMLTLSTPAFVPDRKTRDAFLKLPQIRVTSEHLAHATVALVGVGTLSNSVFVERGVFNNQELQKLAAKGAVGEICGRFYDRHGRECDSPWRERVISIELDQLRKIPQVVGIVAGGDRSAALRAALRGNLIKSLVIDEAGAALLEQDSTKRSRASRSANTP